MVEVLSEETRMGADVRAAVDGDGARLNVLERGPQLFEQRAVLIPEQLQRLAAPLAPAQIDGRQPEVSDLFDFRRQRGRSGGLRREHYAGVRLRVPISEVRVAGTAPSLFPDDHL